jgi:hypothetical protein
MAANSVAQPQGDQELPHLAKPETLGHKPMTEYVSPGKEEKAEPAAPLENDASKMSTTRVAMLLGIIWVTHCLALLSLSTNIIMIRPC